MGQINIFSLVLRTTCYFSRGLHDDCGPKDYVFLRENAGICRRVVGEEELIKIKVCPKGYVLKTNVRMMCTRVDFIFWKGRTEIFLQLSFK